jgi:hypothetical protein
MGVCSGSAGGGVATLEAASGADPAGAIAAFGAGSPNGAATTGLATTGAATGDGAAGGEARVGAVIRAGSAGEGMLVGRGPACAAPSARRGARGGIATSAVDDMLCDALAEPPLTGVRAATILSAEGPLSRRIPAMTAAAIPAAARQVRTFCESHRVPGGRTDAGRGGCATWIASAGNCSLMVSAGACVAEAIGV